MIDTLTHSATTARHGYLTFELNSIDNNMFFIMLDHPFKVISFMYSFKLQLTKFTTDIILHRIQYSPWGPHFSFFHWVSPWRHPSSLTSSDTQIFSFLQKASRACMVWNYERVKDCHSEKKFIPRWDSNRVPPGHRESALSIWPRQPFTFLHFI